MRGHNMNNQNNSNRIRLQKYLASCGVASRRKAEELIANGQVSVNNEVITEMGYTVGAKDVIKVNGKLITKELKKYYVINKPRNIISAVTDDLNRTTVIDILPNEIKQERLFPVGRLDYDTKGILLITNDGDFMNALVGPRSGIEKEYLVRINGIVTKKELTVFEKGITIKGKKLLPALAEIESVDRKNNSSLIRIILTEGKYHQIKEMFAAINHPVKRLTRVRFGCIEINGLKEGQIRELSPHEIKALIGLAKKDKILKKDKVENYRVY